MSSKIIVFLKRNFRKTGHALPAVKGISPKHLARIEPLNSNAATAFSLSSPNEERAGVRSCQGTGAYSFNVGCSMLVVRCSRVHGKPRLPTMDAHWDHEPHGRPQALLPLLAKRGEGGVRSFRAQGDMALILESDFGPRISFGFLVAPQRSDGGRISSFGFTPLVHPKVAPRVHRENFHSYTFP